MKNDYLITNPRSLNYGNNATLLTDSRRLSWIWRS